jgi:cytochrome b561
MLGSQWETAPLKRYNLAQIALHWLVVLLAAGQYATSGAMLRAHAYRPLGQRPDPFDQTLHLVHMRAGLLIFAVVAVRMLLRIFAGAADWQMPLPVWRRHLSRAVQYGLYVVLLAQPVTGAD